MRYSALSVAALGIATALANPTTAAACEPEYQVKRGDSLSEIAERFLGRISEYRTLHAMNRDVIGPNPARIEIGTVLRIPCPNGEQAFVQPEPPITEPSDPILDAATSDRLNDWHALIHSADLAALIDADAVEVVDIRTTLEHRRGAPEDAISLPFVLWRAEVDSASAMPNTTKLAIEIADAGLTVDRPIVLVTASTSLQDMARASWVYWILKSAGAEQVSILNGGLEAWREAGFGLGPGTRRSPVLSASLTLSNDWRASRDQVGQISGGQSFGDLIDGRDKPVFDGVAQNDPLLQTPLPGAHRLPAEATWEAGQGRSGGEQILELLKGQPINWEVETVVSVAATGPLAALNWFYASEVAGIRDVLVYPGRAADLLSGPGKLAPTAALQTNSQ
ncbi:MAG: rhodanese-like domain-containing protein [Pseudomonadota bacterium]